MSATANRTDTTYTFGVITPEELDRLSEATSQGSFQQWSGQVRLAKIRGMKPNALACATHPAIW